MKQLSPYQTTERPMNVLDKPKAYHSKSYEEHQSTSTLEPTAGQAINGLETVKSAYNNRAVTQPQSNNDQTPTPVLGISLSDEIIMPKHDMYQDPAMPDRRLTNTDYLTRPRTSKDTYTKQQPKENKIR